MAKDIVFRALEPDDLKKVFDAGREIFSNNEYLLSEWDEKNIVDVIHRDIDISVIALQRKKILGFIIASIDEIDNTVVKISWMGVIEPLVKNRFIEKLFSFFKKNLSMYSIETVSIGADKRDDFLVKTVQELSFNISSEKLNFHIKL